MPTDLHEAESPDRHYNCMATQQKAIYNWYESRHSEDDVVDIYSAEWQQRITLWHEEFIKKYGREHVHSETPRLREAPEDLEYWSFFFEHPTAAFSLWHVFQAFYDFDKAVCGTSSEAESTLKSWQEMKPFKYLESEDVQRRWKNDLKKLDIEIVYGDLSGEVLKSRMYDILDAVERLETALTSLEGDFKFDYDDSKSTEWMLDTITDAFDKRCVMIAKFLKKDATEPTYEVLLSDSRVERSNTDPFGSLGQRALRPAEQNDHLYPLLSILDHLYVHVYAIAYVIFSVVIFGILSLYVGSGPQGFGTGSKSYE